MGFVTIRDVAKQAGVSITAVSQILHDKGRFSDDTRQHVMETVREMGYVPDQRARAMRSTNNNTIGLLVPDLRNQYFANLVSSMEDELYRRGYTTLIGTSSENINRQDEFINGLLGQRIVGAIVVPQGVDTVGIQSLIRSQLPLVFVDRYVQGIKSVPFVVSDPYPGIRAAVEELVQLGHRRIGFVSHPSLGSFNVNERENSFRKVIRELGMVEATIVSCDATYESHGAALDELIDHSVTSILFSYSPDAITVLGLIHDRGVDAQSSISVVSFDDIPVFRLMTPSISVISQQPEDMGRKGVEILMQQIADGSSLETKPHYVPTVFIARRSCERVNKD